MLRLPAVSDSPIFVPELVRRMVSWRELAWYAREIVKHLPTLAMGWIKIALRYGTRRLPLFLPFMPMRGDVNVILSSREVHPKSPLFKDASKWVFVGGTMDPETRPDPFDFSRLDGRPLGARRLARHDPVHQRRVLPHGDGAFCRLPRAVRPRRRAGSDPARLGTPPENFIVVPTYPNCRCSSARPPSSRMAGSAAFMRACGTACRWSRCRSDFEQLRNSRAAQDGALILDARCYGGEVDGADLRKALETVMGDPSYRAASKRLGDSLRQGGGSAAAADAIEQVAARSQQVHPASAISAVTDRA